MKICQDMDGVIFNLMEEYCEQYNKKYDSDKTMKDVNNWAFYEDWGMTEEECFEIFDVIDQRRLKLIDPMIPRYLKLMMEDNELDIVTLKPLEMEPVIKEALAINRIFEGEHYNNLIVKHYGVSDIKITLDYKLYIDDNPKLAASFPRDDKWLLLYDSPWNRNVNEDRVVRVYNWADILNKTALIGSQ